MFRSLDTFDIASHLTNFAKYFGSGVLNIATTFIHLLSPALDALGSPCLAEGWQGYPYALALCLLSIFALFISEFLAFRWGTAEDPDAELGSVRSGGSPPSSLDFAWAQVIGIVVLVLIGLTLAVDENFRVICVVLIFRRSLGIGTRLAFLRFPGHPQYERWFPILGALLYGITTPVGIAAGLGVCTTYNPGSSTASIVSGVMDSLIFYNILFLFNKEMMNASNGKLAYAIGSMLLGCALMALLGRWA
ncbi:hypothetical protein K435DRAFT_818527 [Dendrothele bispora CBS 962.96]|uniref:Zinc/iron permease n=1 Tax=Dendrothele bispora (strain CBS 962.96) TaxID=1314807 RepID=A0A4S8MAU7_DENBC|nr:hypothetical protein K435DRAFT_818527 [Dendrothele bispora CBS 962.96]